MKCKTCGKNADSEYCFQHKPRKALSKNSRMNPSLPAKKAGGDGKSQQMHEFFMSIWKKRLHLSELSGLPLVGEASSAYFHHILPKSKYPQAMFDEDNIILLSLWEHENVENDMYKYEEINNKRIILKIKYNLQ